MKLCNLNTAKVLQELGYDGEYTCCHVGVYPKNEYQIMTLTECAKYRHDISILCAAPRLDDVAYWLREHYKILITIDYVWYDGYQYSISQNFAKKRPNVVLSVGYDTYDSALEAAVTKAIEIIKNRKQ